MILKRYCFCRLTYISIAKCMELLETYLVENIQICSALSECFKHRATFFSSAQKSTEMRRSATVRILKIDQIAGVDNQMPG